MHSRGRGTATYQAGNYVGYLRGQSSDFNAGFALDEAKFWQFLEATQTDELAKLTYKPDDRRQIVERLHRKLVPFRRRLTKPILLKEKWGAEEIKKRGADLAQRAAARWTR